MSVMNQSAEEQAECPLCMEPLEVDDLHFYPCTCGYQICRFCWNRIRESETGLCPACRKAYPEDPADFTPLSKEQVAAIKTEKKAKEQKRRNKTLESRRALANVRVVQKNLVFVVGLPVRLADPETLKRQEYFGKYGKIHKVVINQSTTYAGTQVRADGPSASAYVTYLSSADALRAIQGVNNVTLDGRVLKGSLGTTKYCANFMKNQPCPKADCMYLHELGDPNASFTKEEMHAGLHQVYERKLHHQLLLASQPQSASSGNSSTEKGSSKDGNLQSFIPGTVLTTSNINIINTSKSNKKDSGSNGLSNCNKEAWPSLGSSPPSDSPSRKQSSPKPNSVKSQENGARSSSESSSSPTQPPAKTKDSKNKKNHSTNNDKKSKNNDGKKKKENKKEIEQKAGVSPPIEINELDHGSYITNDLDDIDSDRHSLLESSDHSLLEDEIHNLLDPKADMLLMNRHKEMLSGLADTNMMHMKSNLVNGFGLLEREALNMLGNDRQINQALLDKEALLRERSRNEMLIRQNEMLARQHNLMLDPKHYMPSTSIETNNELLGANYHHNPNMLPSFGRRVENSLSSNNLSVNHVGMGNNISGNQMSNTLTNGLASMTNGLGNISNGMSVNSLVNGMINGMNVNSMTNGLSNSMGGGAINVNSLGGLSNMNAMNNGMGSAAFLMHNQILQNQQCQQMQTGLMNGFDTQQQTQNEGRYLTENMDKFFTDFHRAQQMRLMASDRRTQQMSQHLSQDWLDNDQKQRINSNNVSSRAAGDADDDLDFDPFKETQKALAEMMESEMLENNVNNGDNLERVRRMPPPGFNHMNAFGVGVQRPQAQTHTQGTQSSMYSDWTQMDPAIMSTSVSFNKQAQSPAQTLSRFSQLSVGRQQHWPQIWNVPPGFAPQQSQNHATECIDAK